MVQHGGGGAVSETCAICHEPCEEVCEQGTGPCCHRSVSWADCISGDYTRAVRAAAGLGPGTWARNPDGPRTVVGW